MNHPTHASTTAANLIWRRRRAAGHLVAEREWLERVARERMERHGEPWELAVGRGLEE